MPSDDGFKLGMFVGIGHLKFIRGSETMWKKLKSKLKINELVGTPKQSLSKKDLQKFHREIDFKLPKSFQEFAIEFGAGELSGFFRIYCPCLEGQFDLNDFNLWFDSELRSSAIARIRNGEESVVENFFAFCSTGGGDLIGWDLSQTTNKDEFEYKIFAIARHDFQVYPLCDRFPEFIENHCLGTEFFKIVDGDAGEWEVWEEFTPYGFIESTKHLPN